MNRSCRTLSVLLFASVAPVAQAAGPQAVTIPGSSLTQPAGGAGDSSGAVLSADGRFVVFVSAANNLVDPPLVGLSLNVYVRDRQTRQTRLVSVAADGRSGGDGDSWDPSVSDDGRWVAFVSRARNLVPQPTTGDGDVFVRDLERGVTRLLSLRQDRTGGGNGASWRPRLAPSGEFAVFESAATNLVPQATSGLGDVFLHRLGAEAPELVSVATNGLAGGSGRSYRSSFSADGHHVLFLTTANNLVPLKPAQMQPGVVLRDLEAGTNSVPILDKDGAVPGTRSEEPAVLAADGKRLAFFSELPNLVADQPAGLGVCLYWRDLEAQRTVLIAAPASPEQRLDPACVLSPDGRYVAYAYTNHVHLWSADSGQVELISVDATGQPAAGMSGNPRMSADATKVAFVSNAPGLVTAPPLPGTTQVFIRDRAGGVTRLISATAAGAASSPVECLFPVLSADGGVVAFEAADSALVPADLNQATDVFASASTPPSVELISVASAGTVAGTANRGGWIAAGGLSADGAHLLFTSWSSDLVAGDQNGVMDVFVRRRADGTTSLVSVNAAGTGAADSASWAPAMSPDARFVAFLSRAGSLVTGDLDTNRIEDVYLRDRQTGLTVLVSRNRDGSGASGVQATGAPVVSPDGRYVAFTSTATDLVTEAKPAVQDVFLRDVLERTTTWISKGASSTATKQPLAVTAAGKVFFLESLGTTRTDLRTGGPTGANSIVVASAATGSPAITPDGRFIALWQTVAGSLSTSLTVIDSSQNKSLEVLSVPTALHRTWRDPSLRLGSNGRFLALTYGADGLVPEDANGPPSGMGTPDVYLVDLERPDVFTLVSRTVDGLAGNGTSESPSLSDDGRYVAFRSWADNLVPGDRNGKPDVFIRDLVQGVTWLASAAPAGGSPLDKSFPPILSADGRTVAFASAAFDLTPNDFNRIPDTFVAAVPALESNDTDRDTLPDDWEQYYFGNLDSTPPDDPDGDGRSNALEQVAGTDPADPLSTLALRLDPASVPTGPATLRWAFVPGRTYTLWLADSLAPGTWQVAPGSPTKSGQEYVWQDPATPGPDHRFYHLRVAR